MKEYDLIIIGSGPAGYTAAIRASQLGMSVVCIDKRATLGGTCLNVGCIPSKALLSASYAYEYGKKHFSSMGIEGNYNLNLTKMLQYKSKIVADLCKGIESLFIKNKIHSITGEAKILDKNHVQVNEKKIFGKHIIIATGSIPISIPNIEVDEKYILSSTGALSIEKVPNKVIAIGAGYICLELGSVWRRLGSDVLVLEYGNRIVPSMDEEVAAQFGRILSKQGMNFKFGCKVEKAYVNNNKVYVDITYANQSNQMISETLDCDVCIVSIGRKAYTEGLGIDSIGIAKDTLGRIIVNHKYQTSLDSVYAVGDVITGPMLAHKAEEEAIAAVNVIAGQYGHVNYTCIPSVIYTDPEVASVGITEQELKNQGIKYKVGKFPFMANSRARTVGATDGFVKILACEKTDKILGAHIIGKDAGNLIQEVVVLMEFHGSSEDLSMICHAHPTLSEAVREACLDVRKLAINM